MNDTLTQAFTILVVGMTSVFFILLMVVLSANILIRVLNTYGLVLNKEEDKAPKVQIPEQVIQKAIAQWSGGKANITKIRKQ